MHQNPLNPFLTNPGIVRHQCSQKHFFVGGGSKNILFCFLILSDNFFDRSIFIFWRLIFKKLFDDVFADQCFVAVKPETSSFLSRFQKMNEVHNFLFLLTKIRAFSDLGQTIDEL